MSERTGCWVECIEAHPETDTVMLHSGYPYVGQAGYVTATYPNVRLALSLATTLEDPVDQGIVCERYAATVTRNLLRENAIELYGL